MYKILGHLPYFYLQQVDDMKDESLSAVLEDITSPPGMELCNTQTFPGYSQHSMIYNLQVGRRSLLNIICDQFCSVIILNISTI